MGWTNDKNDIPLNPDVGMGNPFTRRNDRSFYIDGSYWLELMRRRQMKELAILAGVLGLALFGLVIGAVIGEDNDE